MWTNKQPLPPDTYTKCTLVGKNQTAVKARFGEREFIVNRLTGRKALLRKLWGGERRKWGQPKRNENGFHWEINHYYFCVRVFIFTNISKICHVWVQTGPTTMMHQYIVHIPLPWELSQEWQEILLTVQMHSLFWSLSSSVRGTRLFSLQISTEHKPVGMCRDSRPWKERKNAYLLTRVKLFIETIGLGHLTHVLFQQTNEFAKNKQERRSSLW